MTIVLIVLVIALVALAWVHFGPRIRRPSRVAATSAAADSVPVRRR